MRTHKGQLLWMRTLETAEELRLALQPRIGSGVRVKYNREWLIERNDYLTIEQARRKLLPQPEVAA